MTTNGALAAFRVVYRVECPSPTQIVSARQFRLAVNHIIAEEVLARSVLDDVVHRLRPVSMTVTDTRRIDPVTMEYDTIHVVRFTETVEDPCGEVRDFLQDVLGLTPRQWEGPWNIVGIALLAPLDQVPVIAS
jgi:hypothetical protein